MYTIYRRNELNIEYQVLETDDNGNEIPLDLSGKRLKFIAKNKDDYSNVDTNAAINKNYILPNNNDSENGLFVITLTSEDTNISPLLYDFQIDIYDEDTEQTITFMQDELNILNSIIKE